MFSGVANEQGALNKELALIEQFLGTDEPLTKDEQKCVNTSNKGAQKIAEAHGKNYSSCIKDFAKGKRVYSFSPVLRRASSQRSLSLGRRLLSKSRRN